MCIEKIGKTNKIPIVKLEINHHTIVKVYIFIPTAIFRKNKNNMCANNLSTHCYIT